MENPAGKNVLTPHRRPVWLLLILGPLLFGALAYWLTRSAAPPPFLEFLPLPSPPLAAERFLPACMVDSLPSACWTFSLTAALWWLWQPADRRGRILVGSIAVGLSVLFEVLQNTGLMPGRCDWADLLASLLAALLAGFILQKIST